MTAAYGKHAFEIVAGQDAHADTQNMIRLMDRWSALGTDTYRRFQHMEAGTETHLVHQILDTDTEAANLGKGVARAAHAAFLYGVLRGNRCAGERQEFLSFITTVTSLQRSLSLAWLWLPLESRRAIWEWQPPREPSSQQGWHTCVVGAAAEARVADAFMRTSAKRCFSPDHMMDAEGIDLLVPFGETSGACVQVKTGAHGGSSVIAFRSPPKPIGPKWRQAALTKLWDGTRALNQRFSLNWMSVYVQVGAHGIEHEDPSDPRLVDTLNRVVNREMDFR